MGFRINRKKFISNNQDGSNVSNNQRDQSGGNNDNNNGDHEGRDTIKDRYHKGHIVTPYTKGLGKTSKTLEKVWDPDPFQGKQIHQEQTSQTQG